MRNVTLDTLRSTEYFCISQSFSSEQLMVSTRRGTFVLVTDHNLYQEVLVSIELDRDDYFDWILDCIVVDLEEEQSDKQEEAKQAKPITFYQYLTAKLQSIRCIH